ncbi:MAG: hypothetical protein ABFD91_05800 [Anaerohalosphaeraceae bacterium]
MYEILIRIESLCLDSPSAALLETGLLILIPAVLLWLAGAYFYTLILGLAGCIVGLVCGFFVSQWFNITLWHGMLTGALVVSLAAMVFRRTLIVILTVFGFALAGTVTWFCLVLKQTSSDINTLAGLSSGPLLESMDTSAQLACLGRIIENGPSLSERLSLLLAEIHQSMSSHPRDMVVITVLGGMVGLLLSWGLGKLMMALCCSAAGSFLMLVGLDVTLLGMNVHLVSWFQPRPAVLTITFLSLAGAGVVFQMILLVHAKRRKRINRR